MSRSSEIEDRTEESGVLVIKGEGSGQRPVVCVRSWSLALFGTFWHQMTPSKRRAPRSRQGANHVKREAWQVTGPTKAERPKGEAQPQRRDQRKKKMANGG